MTNTDKRIGARWEDEAEEALRQQGFVIIDRAGVSDYQGWCVLLGQRDTEFAVLAWSYGSCSGCDPWEDLPAEQVLEALTESIRICADEQTARRSFEEGKGW